MTLSTKLQARVNARRRKREETQRRQRNLHNIGAALGLSAGIAAFAFGAQHPTSTLPSTPDWRTSVSYTSPTELSQPAPPPAAETAEATPEPTRCNPYVNGVYVGELCGDHDAFQGRLDRAFAPED